jgi:hypothetical protein
MAYITVVSGSAQPVFATDVLNGPIAASANLAAQGPVNFAGPKLDFYGLTANAALTGNIGGPATAVNGFISNTLQAIQQVSTVAMYQISPAANVLNVATFPVGGFANSAVLLATAQGANGAIGWSSAGYAATFTTPTPA